MTKLQIHVYYSANPRLSYVITTGTLIMKRVERSFHEHKWQIFITLAAILSRLQGPDCHCISAIS